MRNLPFIYLLITLTFTSSSAAASPQPETKTLNISDYKGRIVYLDFWASWCLPCKKSFPFMNDLKAKFEAMGLSIISVNTDYQLLDAKEFLKKTPANFEVFFDPYGELVSEYQVQAMPTSFVFDRQGKLIGKHLGFKTKDIEKISAEIELLLKQ